MEKLLITISCSVSLGSAGKDSKGKNIPEDEELILKEKIAYKHIKNVLTLTRLNRSVDDYTLKILNNQAFFTLKKA